MAAAADASSEWTPVDIDASSCDTLKAAKLLAPQVDMGSDGKWKADRSAPGDGVRRCGMICNKHEACAFRLLIKQSGGAYCFVVKGTHSDLLSSGKRANSALSWAEAQFASTSAKTGAKPAEMMAAMTEDALTLAKQKGETPHKKADGGLEGEEALCVEGYSVLRANEPYPCMYSACISHVFLMYSVCCFYSTCIPDVFLMYA